MIILAVAASLFAATVPTSSFGQACAENSETFSRACVDDAYSVGFDRGYRAACLSVGGSTSVALGTYNCTRQDDHPSAPVYTMGTGSTISSTGTGVTSGLEIDPDLLNSLNLNTIQPGFGGFGQPQE